MKEKELRFVLKVENGDVVLYLNEGMNSAARVDEIPSKYHARNIISMLMEVAKYQKVFGENKVSFEMDLEELKVVDEHE